MFTFHPNLSQGKRSGSMSKRYPFPTFLCFQREVAWGVEPCYALRGLGFLVFLLATGMEQHSIRAPLPSRCFGVCAALPKLTALVSSRLTLEMIAGRLQRSSRARSTDQELTHARTKPDIIQRHDHRRVCLRGVAQQFLYLVRLRMPLGKRVRQRALLSLSRGTCRSHNLR